MGEHNKQLNTLPIAAIVEHSLATPCKCHQRVKRTSSQQHLPPHNHMVMAHLCCCSVASASTSVLSRLSPRLIKLGVVSAAVLSVASWGWGWYVEGEVGRASGNRDVVRLLSTAETGWSQD